MHIFDLLIAGLLVTKLLVTWYLEEALPLQLIRQQPIQLYWLLSLGLHPDGAGAPDGANWLFPPINLFIDLAVTGMEAC